MKKDLGRFLCIAMLISTLGISLLLSFGINLPYNIVCTNYVLYVSILPDILVVLIDLFEVALFAAGFSIIIFSLFMKLPTVRLLLIYTASMLLRRAFDLCGALILGNALSVDDIVYNLLYFALDVAMGTAVFLISRARAKKHHIKLALNSKKDALFSNDEITADPDTASVYPFKKIYSKENPPQVCALSASIILSAVKIISRIIYDIGYGAPSLSEIPVMIIYYSSDILIGIILYAALTVGMNILFKQYKNQR